MKKIIAFTLSLVTVLLTLSGCVFRKNDVVLIISGTGISREIYTYYYDLVCGRPSDYGLKSGSSEKEKQEAAIELCKKYLAFNTSFVNRNLSLSASEKVSISNNVNNMWLINKKHYNKIGISKQTLTKIFTSQAYSEAIFNYLFDPGVADSANEKKIMDYFYSNYVAFRSICAYFTDSAGNRMPGVQVNEITTAFNTVVSEAGVDSQSFTDACEEAGYTASDIVILNNTSDGYPEGFYNSVHVLAADRVRTLTYEDCIFAVRKEDIEQLGEGVYAGYRSECIKAMYAEEWQADIDEYVTQFTVDKFDV